MQKENATTLQILQSMEISEVSNKKSRLKRDFLLLARWLRGNACGEVAQGKWPAAKGKVRHTDQKVPQNIYIAASPLNTKSVPLYNLMRHTTPLGEARSP